VELVVSGRIKLLMACDWTNLTAVQAVQLGLADPLRYFIKGEAHPKLKLETGRLRLINSISCVDQMVERFFSAWQNKREIALWRSIPSKSGFGFSESASLDFYASLPTDLVETDVSGWDWSVQESELHLEALSRITLMKGITSEMASLITNRFHLLANKVCVFSDLHAVTVEGGVMPSGSYNTSASNSRIRWFLAKDIGSVNVSAMGDDCLEQNPAPCEQIKARYVALGHPVKDVRRSHRDDFEFCSQRYTNGIPVPVSLGKTFCKLMSGKGTQQQIAQFKDYAGQHRDFELLMEIAERVGIPSNENKETIHEPAQIKGLVSSGKRESVERPPRQL
jgi:hypothetical protein